MNLTINGNPITIKPCTIFDYISDQNFPIENLVVEHNQTIIPQSDWQHVLLQEGDQLEILCFVGGG